MKILSTVFALYLFVLVTTAVRYAATSEFYVAVDGLPTITSGTYCDH